MGLEVRWAKADGSSGALTEEGGPLLGVIVQEKVLPRFGSRLLLAVASLVATTALWAAPAHAAPLAVTFADDCGVVRIAYTGDGSASGNFAITRNGEEFYTGVTAGGSTTAGFSVAARAGEVIGLTGALVGTHTHASTGCTEPQVRITSIEDRCQDTAAIVFHNAASAGADHFSLMKGGVHTGIPPIPPGDSSFLVTGLSGISAFEIQWGDSEQSIVRAYTYHSPANCGAETLAVSYVDKCGTLEYSVHNDAAAPQRVELVKGDTVVASHWVPAGESPAHSVSAIEATSYLLRVAGSGTALGGEHTFHVPAACVGLPTTGARTQLYLWGSVSLIGAGAFAFFFSRRRRTASF
jgi:LPXTG-motif cell wall-anchored protein